MARDAATETPKPETPAAPCDGAPRTADLGAPLAIGSLRLVSNLVLAPLAGFTDLAFRLCCREQGAVGLATTEMVSAAALLRDARSTPRYLVTCPEDQPLSVQIEGGSADVLCEAARRIEDRGFAAVDINMGCPVQRITKKGGGSAWTQSPEQAAEAVGRVVEAVAIPVTVKTRLGWDEGQETAPDLARALEAAGIAALTIHGRTRAQGFGGAVRHEGIREVVRAVRALPIIGNGDVREPEDARRMLEATGCAGVAIGRAALGDPWIFRSTWRYLRDGAPPEPPSREERLRFVRRHFEHLHALFGERDAVIRFRKAGVRYSGPLATGKRYRKTMSFARDAAHVREILDDVERGVYDLPRSERRARFEVRVPKGPVERW